MRCCLLFRERVIQAKLGVKEEQFPKLSSHGDAKVVGGVVTKIAVDS